MSENTDTRTDEQKAPKKTAAAKAPKAPKEPKPPKEPKAPKEPWTAPADAVAVVDVMKRYAAAGDKKTLAFFVNEAIACRAAGKESREQCTTSPTGGEG